MTTLEYLVGKNGEELWHWAEGLSEEQLRAAHIMYESIKVLQELDAETKMTPDDKTEVAQYYLLSLEPLREERINRVILAVGKHKHKHEGK